MPSSKVQQLPNGALVITIPKTFAELTSINKGDLIKWELKKNQLILKNIK